MRQRSALFFYTGTRYKLRISFHVLFGCLRTSEIANFRLLLCRLAERGKRHGLGGRPGQWQPRSHRCAFPARPPDPPLCPHGCPPRPRLRSEPPARAAAFAFLLLLSYFLLSHHQPVRRRRLRCHGSGARRTTNEQILRDCVAPPASRNLRDQANRCLYYYTELYSQCCNALVRQPSARTAPVLSRPAEPHAPSQQKKHLVNLGTTRLGAMPMIARGSSPYAGSVLLLTCFRPRPSFPRTNQMLYPTCSHRA